MQNFRNCHVMWLRLMHASERANERVYMRVYEKVLEISLFNPFTVECESVGGRAFKRWKTTRTARRALFDL
jgi:hypothetical protein